MIFGSVGAFASRTLEIRLLVRLVAPLDLEEFVADLALFEPLVDLATPFFELLAAPLVDRFASFFFDTLTMARINSSFRMECQPLTPSFFAIWAKSRELHVLKDDAVIKWIPSDFAACNSTAIRVRVSKRNLPAESVSVLGLFPAVQLKTVGIPFRPVTNSACDPLGPTQNRGGSFAHGFAIANRFFL